MILMDRRSPTSDPGATPLVLRNDLVAVSYCKSRYSIRDEGQSNMSCGLSQRSWPVVQSLSCVPVSPGTKKTVLLEDIFSTDLIEVTRELVADEREDSNV